MTLSLALIESEHYLGKPTTLQQLWKRFPMLRKPFLQSAYVNPSDQLDVLPWCQIQMLIFCNQ
jgi:hypothetical protein